jgi:hypothetical protein
VLTVFSAQHHDLCGRCQETAENRRRSGDRTNDEAGQRNIFIYKRYQLSLALFFLALLSKPMAVTLSMILLILDW